jgi:hypothetical protein
MTDDGDMYYRRIKRAYGDIVPPRDYVDVCRCLYPSVLGLFYEVSQLGTDIRVLRVWVDDGRLRVVISGSARGFDNILVDIEEEAAAAMKDHCTCGRQPL